MKINQAQKDSYKIIEEYNEKNNLKHNKATVFPHLIEEVGELSRELNHGINNWREDFDKEKLGEEMADVLCQIFNLATDYNINLEKAFKNKIKKLRKRFELDEK